MPVGWIAVLDVNYDHVLLNAVQDELTDAILVIHSLGDEMMALVRSS